MSVPSEFNYLVKARSNQVSQRREGFEGLQRRETVIQTTESVKNCFRQLSRPQLEDMKRSVDKVDVSDATITNTLETRWKITQFIEALVRKVFSNFNQQRHDALSQKIRDIQGNVQAIKAQIEERLNKLDALELNEEFQWANQMFGFDYDVSWANLLNDYKNDAYNPQRITNWIQNRLDNFPNVVSQTKGELLDRDDFVRDASGVLQGLMKNSADFNNLFDIQKLAAKYRNGEKTVDIDFMKRIILAQNPPIQLGDITKLILESETTKIDIDKMKDELALKHKLTVGGVDLAIEYRDKLEANNFIEHDELGNKKVKSEKSLTEEEKTNLNAIRDDHFMWGEAPKFEAAIFQPEFEAVYQYDIETLGRMLTAQRAEVFNLMKKAISDIYIQHNKNQIFELDCLSGDNFARALLEANEEEYDKQKTDSQKSLRFHQDYMAISEHYEIMFRHGLSKMPDFWMPDDQIANHNNIWDKFLITRDFSPLKQLDDPAEFVLTVRSRPEIAKIAMTVIRMEDPELQPLRDAFVKILRTGYVPEVQTSKNNFRKIKFEKNLAQYRDKVGLKAIVNGGVQRIAATKEFKLMADIFVDRLMYSVTQTTFMMHVDGLFEDVANQFPDLQDLTDLDRTELLEAILVIAGKGALIVKFKDLQDNGLETFSEFEDAIMHFEGVETGYKQDLDTMRGLFNKARIRADGRSSILRELERKLQKLTALNELLA